MSGRLVAQRNPVKMIFGFNTDIKAENTVYHVQTEVREHERRLESQVFVSGRCIGKRSAPLPPQAVEEEIQELARAQHRWIVDAVREGFVDDVLNQEVSESLAVQFLGSHRIAEKAVKLSFRVLSGGFVAASAHVEAHWKTDSSAGVLESAITDEFGIAEMRFELTGGKVELEIKVQLDGRETVRRFLVKSGKT